MTPPWLSILIPVYNVSPYLRACLDSVIHQAMDGVEIMVLDDQSTDDSYAQLCAYAKASPHPISILQHGHNRGLSAARNSLLEAATGTYLWFLDSDDLLQCGALARLSEIINTHQPDLVLCDHQLWRSESALLPPPASAQDEHYRSSFAGPSGQLLEDPEALFAGIYAKGKLHAWSKIAKRSLWSADLRFPEGRYFEDMVTTPRLAIKADNYYYCAESWIVYRQRDTSILATFSIKKIDDMVKGLEGILPAWKEKCPSMSVHSRYLFLRYAVKIYFYTRTELKRLGQYNRVSRKQYLQQILTSLQLSKREIIYNFIAAGDLSRAIKIFFVL